MDRMFDFSDRKDASGTMNNWESINFYHVPLAAGITILSKIQSDVRNAEGEVVKRMMDAVEGKSFKFNKLTTIVKPQSSYVTVGASTGGDLPGRLRRPERPRGVHLRPGAGGHHLKPPDQRGIHQAAHERCHGRAGANGRWCWPADRHRYHQVQAGGRRRQVQPFETEYEVAAPSLVVSPTKMNVFYRGVDNPVSVSVAGYSDKDIAAPA
jgi:hypothetical protein